MGLDMYIYRQEYHEKGYTPKNFIKFMDSPPIEGLTEAVYKDADDNPYTLEVVGYFREAYEINDWFVDNVQNGQDDCRTYPVSEDKIALLIALLTADGDRLPLPPRDTTREYMRTSSYWRKIFAGVHMLKGVIKDMHEPENKGKMYFYHSSW